MSFHIHSDWSEAEREIKRVMREPGPATRQALSSVLRKGFAETQAVVHVQTGSLMSSGKYSTSYHKARAVWEGNISYGGPSAGVNNPVDYAIYEKARGDAHDFTAPLHGLDDLYIAAILKGLSK